MQLQVKRKASDGLNYVMVSFHHESSTLRRLQLPEESLLEMVPGHVKLYSMRFCQSVN